MCKYSCKLNVNIYVKLGVNLKKIIVIGSGIAALSFVHALHKDIQIICMTKDNLKQNNSHLAQGGVCFSNQEKDLARLHVEDTFMSGHKLGDEYIIQEMIRHSHACIQQLIDEGMNFDKRNDGETLALAMEGAHSKPRIVHAGGDQTGQYIMKHLIQAVKDKAVTFYEETEVVDLLRDDDGEVSGVLAIDKNNQQIVVQGDEIVLASGGYSNLFQTHSSASNTLSTGHLIALHHGIPLRHMEMIQFHPTLLGTSTQTFGLVSEAVRGDGGKLVNEYGKQFMDEVHPLASLAPRDITSRIIFHQQRLGHTCMIDIKPIEDFPEKFPGIYRNVITYFPDEYKSQRIPVSCGAHYTMGGIKANIDGTTSLPHVYAIGEVSNTNFHGANRLASNSLLEGLVMGQRCAAIVNNLAIRQKSRCQPSQLRIPKIEQRQYEQLISQSFDKLGIERDGQSMKRYLKELQHCLTEHPIVEDFTREDWQKYARLKTLEIVCMSAVNRTESRGAHYRIDYPKRNKNFQNIDIEIEMGAALRVKQIKRSRETQAILHRG